jgi:N-acetylglucosamine kinase-like BadF-type ATPase
MYSESMNQPQRPTPKPPLTDPLFLGIDIGGTKTHALLADEQGRAVGFGEGGPGNPDGVGHDGMAAVMQASLEAALTQAGASRAQIAGAGFGIGGLDWPAQHPLMLETIARLGLDCPVEAVNDAILGLLAGSEQGWGVSVVAGTGCNCWGIDRQRRTGQVTGLGAWMGEAAGAGELVHAAIVAIAREWTHRGPPTALTQAFAQRVGAADALDLLEGLGMGRFQIRASAAPLVFAVAREGDPVALELVRWAGRELGDLAVGVIRQLHFENEAFEVVLAGSFYKGSPLVAEELGRMVQRVAPAARLVRLHAPPVVGGALLGMDLSGRDPRPLRPRLIQSVEYVVNSHA